LFRLETAAYLLTTVFELGIDVLAYLLITKQVPPLQDAYFMSDERCHENINYV